jgi:hypothetical protein
MELQIQHERAVSAQIANTATKDDDEDEYEGEEIEN